MLLSTLPNPQIPLPSHTFYPYPLSSRLATHSSILKPLSPYAYGHDLKLLHEDENGAGPSLSSDESSYASYKRERERHRSALKRAEMRALLGKRPAGVELSKEADELSEEERIMEDERDNLNLFGHRFLLPYGRRQTQSELDAAPASPTPSQDQHDHLQEEPAAGAADVPAGAMDLDMQDGEDGEEGEEVDLDASVEDMDADDYDDADEEGLPSEEE